MSFSRAPWWMYIVAACLFGNFSLNIYVYCWGPEPPFSRYNFAREALVVEELLHVEGRYAVYRVREGR